MNPSLNHAAQVILAYSICHGYAIAEWPEDIIARFPGHIAYGAFCIWVKRIMRLGNRERCVQGIRVLRDLGVTMPAVWPLR